MSGAAAGPIAATVGRPRPLPVAGQLPAARPRVGLPTMRFDRRLQRNLGKLLVIVAFGLIVFESISEQSSGTSILVLGLPLDAVGAIVLGIGAWLWFIRSRRPER